MGSCIAYSGPAARPTPPPTVALLLDVSVEAGKYRVQQEACGAVRILRHGEQWIAHMDGQKCVLAMAHELEERRSQLAVAVKLLDEFIIKGERGDSRLTTAIQARQFITTWAALA